MCNNAYTQCKRGTGVLKEASGWSVTSECGWAFLSNNFASAVAYLSLFSYNRIIIRIILRKGTAEATKDTICMSLNFV